MPLIDSWSHLSTTSTTTQVVTVPNIIPIGSVIFAAVVRGGAVPVSSISSVDGNDWTVVDYGPHTSSTFNLCFAFCIVDSEIDAGSTFTLIAASASNRWASVFGVFDDVILPANYENIAAVQSATTPIVDVGPTPTLAAPRALVVTGAAFTGAGYPIDNSGNAIVDQVVTAAGSSDRAAALLYKYEGGHTHTGTYLIPSSTTSAGFTAAFETDDLPPGTIPYMTDEGEIPGVLSVWDGTIEHPVVELEIAP